MFQVRWLKGPVCGTDNCRSRLYRRDAGNKFCQFGHVIDGDLDIDDEDGETYSQTKRLKVQLTDTGFGSQGSSALAPVALHQRRRLSRRGPQRLYGEEGRTHAFTCLQYILRKITPKVVLYLYMDFGDDAVQSLRVNLDPVLKLLWIRCVKVAYARALPTVIDLYVIIFLALRQLNRYPVYVDRYLEMTSKNKVPVVDATTLLPPDMLAHIPHHLAWIFAARNTLLEGAFYTLMSKWSAPLKLRGTVPASLDFSYPLAFKLLTDLRIPHAPQLLTVYHGLALEVTGGFFREMAYTFTVAEAQIVGLIHYVIRIYLLASEDIFDTTQWNEWMSQDDEIPCFRNHVHHMSIETLMDLSKQQVSTYLEWVYENLVPDGYRNPEGEGLSVPEKKLGEILPFPEADPSSTNANSTMPFPVVKNNLSPADLAQIELQLETFLCTRYGLTPSLLQALRQRIEKKLSKKLYGRRLKLPNWAKTRIW